jgi:endonuclease III related protein
VNTSSILLNVYRVLYEFNGHLKWWPGDTDFEVCIGAILTQNTAWTNVEKAILNLKNNGILDIDKISASKPEEIARFIKPSGYFNQKSFYLIEFCKFLQKNSLDSLRIMEMYKARDFLLSVKGVGKETADSIMLYALDFPIFVVDAYTKRIFSRLGLIKDDFSYDEVQNFFMTNLFIDVVFFNDYHAQIVELAKNFCKKKPVCDLCPLKKENLCKYFLNLKNQNAKIIKKS